MDSSENEKCIDGVVLSILALFNDSGGRNMPRDLAAYTGFSPTVRPAAEESCLFARKSARVAVT